MRDKLKENVLGKKVMKNEQVKKRNKKHEKVLFLNLSGSSSFSLLATFLRESESEMKKEKDCLDMHRMLT